MSASPQRARESREKQRQRRSSAQQDQRSRSACGDRRQAPPSWRAGRRRVVVRYQTAQSATVITDRLTASAATRPVFPSRNCAGDSGGKGRRRCASTSLVPQPDADEIAISRPNIDSAAGQGPDDLHVWPVVSWLMRYDARSPAPRTRRCGMARGRGPIADGIGAPARFRMITLMSRGCDSAHAEGKGLRVWRMGLSDLIRAPSAEAPP